ANDDAGRLCEHALHASRSHRFSANPASRGLGEPAQRPRGLGFLLDDAEAHHGVIDRGASARLPDLEGLVICRERAKPLQLRTRCERGEAQIRVFPAHHPKARHGVPMACRISATYSGTPAPSARIEMPYASLRDFIDRLERAGELVRVQTPVSPELEITEIHTRLLAEGGPAVLFEEVRRRDGARYDMPVLTNLFGTVERVALGMDRAPH